MNIAQKFNNLLSVNFKLSDDNRLSINDYFRGLNDGYEIFANDIYDLITNEEGAGHLIILFSDLSVYISFPPDKDRLSINYSITDMRELLENQSPFLIEILKSSNVKLPDGLKKILDQIHTT